jgi:hypothetical protein
MGIVCAPAACAARERVESTPSNATRMDNLRMSDYEKP